MPQKGGLAGPRLTACARPLSAPPPRSPAGPGSGTPPGDPFGGKSRPGGCLGGKGWRSAGLGRCGGVAAALLPGAGECARGPTGAAASAALAASQCRACRRRGGQPPPRSRGRASAAAPCRRRGPWGRAPCISRTAAALCGRRAPPPRSRGRPRAGSPGRGGARVGARCWLRRLQPTGPARWREATQRACALCAAQRSGAARAHHRCCRSHWAPASSCLPRSGSPRAPQSNRQAWRRACAERGTRRGKAWNWGGRASWQTRARMVALQLHETTAEAYP